MHARTPIGILGATGMVGQRLVQRLARHPTLDIAVVAASQRSAGRPYGEATSWHLAGEVPEDIARLQVKTCDPTEFPANVKMVLSALDGKVAGPIESVFRDAGYAVVTNASAWRMAPEVPLVIPEVNPDHLQLLKLRQTRGFIVANPNCCTIPLCLALAPLAARWPIESVVVATYQAVSGAGYPGESAWDMVGTVHPHAGPEEDKLAIEPLKIMGSMGRAAEFPISARCVRVPVADGHLLAIHVRLTGDPGPDEVASCLAQWRGNGPALHSCPQPPLRLSSRRDRPSPRFDVDAGDGMQITIGRVEHCAVLGIKLFALGHNTIRGAAGAAIANAELLIQTGLLPA